MVKEQFQMLRHRLTDPTEIEAWKRLNNTLRARGEGFRIKFLEAHKKEIDNKEILKRSGYWD
ncbi:MAG: hypothetical protein JXL84_09265 [Deltaproteobacteria bacterium]|nr:hypothetical protein [Deltaproteobacteria bacterium]